MAPEISIRAMIDETLAPRIANQAAYLAYSHSGFCLENAGLLYVRDGYRTQYLDWSNPLMPVGHVNDQVKASVFEQLNHYGNVGRPGKYVLRWPVEYAKALSESLPNRSASPLKVLFTTDEDTALGTAISMAQRVTERVFLTTKVDTDYTHWQEMAALLLHYVDQHGNLQDPRQVADMVEQAHQGGALVISDEIRMGFGRSGRLWAQDRWGVKADITVVGGPGGGGFPFGAVIAPKEYFDVCDDEITPDRTAGHPAICAAGYQTLAQITSPVLLHVEEASGVFHAALTELKDQFPEVVAGASGVGMLQHLKFRSSLDAKAFHQRCQGVGMLTNPPVGRSMALTPALITSELEIKRGVDMMSEVLMDWEEPVVSSSA